MTNSGFSSSSSKIVPNDTSFEKVACNLVHFRKFKVRDNFVNVPDWLGNAVEYFISHCNLELFFF